MAAAIQQKPYNQVDGLEEIHYRRDEIVCSFVFASSKKVEEYRQAVLAACPDVLTGENFTKISPHRVLTFAPPKPAGRPISISGFSDDTFAFINQIARAMLIAASREHGGVAIFEHYGRLT